jgi:hypothetical protein
VYCGHVMYDNLVDDLDQGSVLQPQCSVQACLSALFAMLPTPPPPQFAILLRDTEAGGRQRSENNAEKEG